MYFKATPQRLLLKYTTQRFGRPVPRVKDALPVTHKEGLKAVLTILCTRYTNERIRIFGFICLQFIITLLTTDEECVTAIRCDT